jgi:RND family efflux transporter MFP subunit
VTESERASILNRIRRMAAEVGGASDAQLLERFASSRDETAFELLLWRHARLVFGVCQRVLRDMHDAEDAFQATFLALARHAGKVNKREALAGWLHKVAYHVALTSRRRRARRTAYERLVGETQAISVSADAEAHAQNQELQHIVDQEIGWLPERFRAPVVLCYLEGRSVDEAAMLLGCPRGTVASRLARARERLRVRLAGRGFAVTAGLAILAQANSAPRPLSLIPALTAAALRYTAGGAAVANRIVSPRITALTEEALRAMFLHKLKTGIVIFIAFLGILLAGGGLAVGLHAHAEPPSPAQVPEAQAAGKEEPDKGKRGAEAPRAVTVRRPNRREAAPFEDFSGRLEARQSVQVHPAVGGVVLKVCFKAGAEVKKGDVLFELDSRASQLAVQKAESELALAAVKQEQENRDLKRLQAVGGNLVPSEQLDKATWRVTSAEAAVRAAKIEVARAQLDLEATKVTAPMAGQVGRPLVDPGALVFRGQDRATVLTTVTALDPITLVFDMDEYTLLRYRRLLREKQVKGVGSVLRMALVGEGGFPHEGKLDSFEARVDPQSGMVLVRGSFANPGQVLLPGMKAQVRMTFGPPRPVLEVPENSVLSDQDKTFVLVVGDGNIAQRRAVTVGWVDNGMRVIEKGLDAEDWVVTGGHGSIHPGDRVEPRKETEPKRSEPPRDKGR